MSKSTMTLAEQAVQNLERAKAAEKAEQDERLREVRAKAAASIAAREKAEAAEKAEQAENQAKMRQERFDVEYRQPALRNWLAAGGTEQEFAEQWPAMRLRLLAEAGEKMQAEARGNQARATKSRF